MLDGFRPKSYNMARLNRNQARTNPHSARDADGGRTGAVQG